MKIKSIIIDNFWESRTINFRLNDDVNILTGINGTGKTTFLNIVFSLLSGQVGNEDIDSKYYSAKIEFQDGSRIDSIGAIGMPKQLSYWDPNGRTVSREQLLDGVGFSVVSTFDSSLSEDQLKNNKEKQIRSALDMYVHESIIMYLRYVNLMFTEIMRMDESGEKIELQKVRALHSQMIRTLNEFFAPSKEWLQSANDVSFRLLDESKRVITPYELSSGEKQLLILVISVLIQAGKPFIVIWDVPETSLHVSWQHKLICLLTSLNPNMQLIMATHSPSLLFEGWERRVINMSDIIR